MLDITRYNVTAPKVQATLKIVLIADLHNVKFDKIMEKLNYISPDLICFAGDLVNRYDGKFDKGLDFLRECNKTALTFFSLGNHDVGFLDHELKNEILQTGTILLDNEFTNWNGLTIGGLTSARDFSNFDFLQKYNDSKNYKILLCHHPEYYTKFLKDYNIDLIVSGHSHGGQWRLFGKGLLAPGQGWFPKLTSGIHFNKLIISRGVGNVVKIPRIFNNPEIVVIEIN